MAFRIPNVPLIPQTLDMACWYASAQMLITWRQGQTKSCELAHPDPSDDPRLVSIYKSNTGLGLTQVTMLAKDLGLEETPRMTPTLQTVETWLQRYGPLWFAGLWPSGHVVVVTGINASGIQINDPWPVNVGRRWTMKVNEFLAVLQPLGSTYLASNFLHFPG
jgi:hypothetical protein